MLGINASVSWHKKSFNRHKASLTNFLKIKKKLILKHFLENIMDNEKVTTFIDSLF